MKTRKTKKIVLGVLIAIALLAGIAPFGSARAESQPFKDVSQADYYYKEVMAMYQQGAISGYGDGTFLPQNTVSHAEALKLVCLAAGFTFSAQTDASKPWYTEVMSFAVEKKIADAGTDPNQAASREEMCKYIAAAFNIPLQTSTDVFTDTDSSLANTLYEYGVISGIPNGDGTLSFGGDNKVKRCEVCVMLFRVKNTVQSSSVQALPSDTEESSDEEKVQIVSNSAEPFVLDMSHYQVARPASFSSFDDYVNAWRYMLANAVLNEQFSLEGSYTRAELTQIMTKAQNAFYFASFDYMEYYSFLNRWKISAMYSLDENGNCLDPTITLRLSNVFGISDSEILQEISVFKESCAQIVTNLFANGTLSTAMTAKEKAYVLYRYVAQHVVYDSSSTLYSGYDAVVGGTAVCQGYTAMYNYLCNIAGAPMVSMTGSCGGNGHVWSRIFSDGVWYNIDSTWGDPTTGDPNYCDDSWFWVSDSYLRNAGKPRSFDSDTLIYG